MHVNEVWKMSCKSAYKGDVEGWCEPKNTSKHPKYSSKILILDSNSYPTFKPRFVTLCFLLFSAVQREEKEEDMCLSFVQIKKW